MCQTTWTGHACCDRPTGKPLLPAACILATKRLVAPQMTQAKSAGPAHQNKVTRRRVIKSRVENGASSALYRKRNIYRGTQRGIFFDRNGKTWRYGQRIDIQRAFLFFFGDIGPPGNPQRQPNSGNGQWRRRADSTRAVALLPHLTSTNCQSSICAILVRPMAKFKRQRQQ
ncbi:hypothetical protein BGW80DRAFT_1281124 [Lactifluus volemus]|nr:hypothetical protein BGW80DRAFT_1281124 [Lactifluus volemus]